MVVRLAYISLTQQLLDLNSKFIINLRYAYNLQTPVSHIDSYS